MGGTTEHDAHVYETVGLDRATGVRGDPRVLEALLRVPEARVLPLRELRIALVADGAPQLALLPPATLPATADPPLFLGLLEGRPVFAAQLPAARAPAGLRWVELGEVGALLDPREAGIAALARALFHWHAHSRFCGRCGARTVVFEGGSVRRCPACGLELHPRVDPAVIVLVHDGAHCLLARSPRFPAGMVSVLAGFVEPGESPEAAVVREVCEEVGLAVEPPRYRSAQPWPFPQALMLGFTARARTRTLRVDRGELVFARWFHREELLRPHPPVCLPRSDSIARRLLDDWLHENPG